MWVARVQLTWVCCKQRVDSWMDLLILSLFLVNERELIFDENKPKNKVKLWSLTGKRVDISAYTYLAIDG